MMAGGQADMVVSSIEDRRFLEAQVRRHDVAFAPGSLPDGFFAEGLQSKQVAERLGVHKQRLANGGDHLFKPGLRD